MRIVHGFQGSDVAEASQKDNKVCIGNGIFLKRGKDVDEEKEVREAILGQNL